MNNRAPLTIDNRTAASNAARAPLSPLRYVWFYPVWPLTWAALLVVSLWLTCKLSFWCLPLALLCLALNVLYWIRVREFFAHGDANPGVVLQLQPTLVAVATDLTQGVGSYPAIKVFRTRLRRALGQPLAVGSRLPTVALYQRSLDPAARHWADFDPRPLACATGDQQALERVMDTFSDQECRRLEAAVQTLPAIRPGLYRLRAWPALAEVPTEGFSAEDFWHLIDRTQADSREQQLALLQGELAQLSTPQLIGFQQRFTELKRAAYQWDLWLVAWLCQGGMCSDDSFADFRNWLIARGQAVYELALREPDALVEELRQAEHPEFEVFGYAAAEAYRSRTGRELSDLPELAGHHPREPLGGDWLRPELKDRTGSHMLNRCVVFQEMGPQEWAAIEQRFLRTWQYRKEQGA
jgi:hypothetical protein